MRANLRRVGQVEEESPDCGKEKKNLKYEEKQDEHGVVHAVDTHPGACPLSLYCILGQEQPVDHVSSPVNVQNPEADGDNQQHKQAKVAEQVSQAASRPVRYSWD